MRRPRDQAARPLTAAPPVREPVPEPAPETPRGPLRVVIASHSHPEISNGGAEIAAFLLFRGLQQRADCATWFIGCERNAESDQRGTAISQPFSDREYIYNSGTFDWFNFANRDPRFPRDITRLFRELAPDVVHFHHYINFGVEVFLHLKQAVPDCRIVLTLHEYLGICHHFGQMVTKRHRSLCYESGPARCQQCFPEIGRSDFFLRKRYIERFLDLVDCFVAPSQFLADRYISWGVPSAKMTVMENMLPAEGRARPVPPPPADGPLRIGFFGQISGLKGIDVLFDAAETLADQQVSGVSLEIFGDYRGQPPEFQQAFLDRLSKGGRNIHFHGPYDRIRVDRLMQSVHAVVMPSIWWENSPVVIQEALRNRRPVLCSDIGGMAEKVRHGVDGFHFAVGSAMALATLLAKLAADRSLLADMTARMPGHAVLEATVEDFVQLYQKNFALR